MTRPVRPRTVLAIFAHPDDESMGPGATLAKLSAAGHRVVFVTATEGGAGRLHELRATTPAEVARLKQVRRAETSAAARVLGIEHLGFLGWEDGTLRDLDVLGIDDTIAALLRRERPDVVLTFHGSGISYHPDHRVLTLATMGAFLGSGRAGWYRDGAPREAAPHAPSKLYVYVPDAGSPFWKEWPSEIYRAGASEITTRIDTSATESVKWAAIQSHDSQKDGPPFRLLFEAGAFREECFVRLFPGFRPGEPIETDLLEGLD